MRLDEVLKALDDNPDKGYRRRVWKADMHIMRNSFGGICPMRVALVEEDMYDHADYMPTIQDLRADDWEEAESIPYTLEEWYRIDHLHEVEEKLERTLRCVDDASCCMDRISESDLCRKLIYIGQDLRGVLKKTRPLLKDAEKRENKEEEKHAEEEEEWDVVSALL